MKALLPPLLAFLIARAFVSVVAHANGFNWADASIWKHWDSGHYLEIAQRGYSYASCAELHYPAPPSAMCGNAGWLPGYPLVIRMLLKLSLRPDFAGALVSALFCCATLVWLWNRPLRGQKAAAGVLCLAIAAFFPSQIYGHAIFPISMFSFFSLAALDCAERRQWIGAGLFGMMAAFTYSTGFLLSPVLAIAALVSEKNVLWKHRILNAAIAAAPTAFGFLAVMLFHRISVGAWDAFFQVQAKYGYGWHNPVRTLVRALRPIWSEHWDGTQVVIAAQTLLVGVGIIPALGISWLRRRREPSNGLAYLLFAAAYWLFPLIMGGGVSLYRAESTLLASVPLLARGGETVEAALLSACIAIAYPMAALFFLNVLV